MEPVHIDLTRPTGAMRRQLHCSGFMPNTSSQRIVDFTEPFRRLNFLEARTHDQALANPAQRVVDTHFVFPLAHADPADPANYYFAATDHLLQTCRSCGTNILYRLGTSIEHTKDAHFNALAPEDFEHNAEIMAGIVRHYTRGWAGGHHWDIRNWEVWNEPDLGAQMWNKPLAEYWRLYGVVAKRLKAEFPEIRVGGPAYCSLHEENTKGFLAFCRREGAPLDFLSWHCYTSDPADLAAQPARARRLLDEAGFAQTETMINEWHYLLTWEGLHNKLSPEGYERAMTGPSGMLGIDSAAFNVSVVSRWHDSPLDWSYYYGCGADFPWGFVTPYLALNKNYYSMLLLGEIVTRFPHRVRAEGGSETTTALAGVDDDGNFGLLVADYRGLDREIPIAISGLGEATRLQAVLLDQDSDLKPLDVTLRDSRMVLSKDSGGSAVFWVTGTPGAA